MVPEGRTNRHPTASRRRLLTAAAAGLAATLSGCSALGRRTLNSPEVDESGRSTILDYHVDDERVAEVALIERWGDADRRRFPIRTLVWHDERHTLERLRYTFRHLGTRYRPEYYLQRPGGYPWEPIRFSSTENGDATVLAVPDLGFQGRGSVTLELIVATRSEDPFDLRVDVEASLAPDGLLGRDYLLEGSIERTIPGQRRE